MGMSFKDAIDFESRQAWISQDTSSNTENVLINQVSLESGNPQYCREFTEGNNVALGHGQDLSLEYGNNKSYCGRV